MPPDYSTWDIGPGEWRRLLTPIGALWLVGLVTGLAGRVVPDLTGQRSTVPVLIALVLCWLVTGLVALSSGWVVERTWLNRWPRLGAPMTRRRQARWAGLHRAMTEAAGTGDTTTALRQARRRNGIAVSAPECPTWMADRWAALESRVRNAYGLDVGATWPRLWLTLPDPVRTELRLAAAQWQRTTVWAGWAVLYVLLAVVWWPAVVIAVVLAGWAWARARIALEYRADLIEAAFDTYGPLVASAMGVVVSPPGLLTPDLGDEITARIRKGS